MNKIYNVVNGKAVSELAKSVTKTLLVSSFLLSGSVAIASDNLVNNFTDSDFLTWIQQPENGEKIEYIKEHFNRDRYDIDYNTNQYLNQPKNVSAISITDVENSNFFVRRRGNKVYFNGSSLKIESNDKSIILNMQNGIQNYQIESESKYNQFKTLIKEKQNEANEAIYEIDDLFFTDSLKDRTVELNNKKYKILELQLEEAWLRHQQLEDPDSQGLAQKLKDNDLQKALIRKELSSISEENKVYKIREGYYEILKEQDKANKEQIDLDVEEIWKEGEAEREKAQEDLEKAKEEEAAERVEAEKEKKKEEILALLPKEVIQVVGDGKTADVDKTITTSTTRDAEGEEITTTTYTVSARTGGQVAQGDDKAVSGDTIYNYLQENQTPATNITEGEGISVTGDTTNKTISVKHDDTLTIDNDNQLSVVKDGAIEKGNAGLVDGGTIFDFIKNNTTEGATTITVTDGKGQTHTFNLTEEGGYKVSGANDNITTEVSEDGMKIKLSNDLNLTNDGSIQVGGVTINNNGIDNGGHKITNLDKGAVGNNSTEAVNGSQLQEVIDMIANKGGATSFTVTDSKGQTHTFNFSEEGGYKVLGANDNISTEVSEEGMKIKLSNDLDLTEDGSVQVGGLTLNNKGVDMGDKTITNLANPVNDTDATNKQYVDNGRTKVTVGNNLGVSDSKGQNGEMIYHVTLDNNLDLTDNGSVQVGGLTLNNNGIDMGNKTITNLSAPLQDLDATNKKYVDDTNTKVTVGNNLSVSGSKGEKGESIYNVSLNKDVDLGEEGSVSAGGVNIDKNGIDAGDKIIANVKDGKISENSKEAVNGSQLYQVQEQINSLDFSNINIDTSRLDKMIVNNTNNINKLDNKINNMDKRLTRGIAMSGAMGMLAQPTVAGKSMMSAAVANYDGEQALAIGYSAISENNKHIIKFSGATSFKGHRKTMVGATYGYQW